MEVLNFVSPAGLTEKDKQQLHKYQKNDELQSLISPFQLFDHDIISPHPLVGSEVKVLACMLQHWQQHTVAIHHFYASRSNR
jgi:hypothetical protein